MTVLWVIAALAFFGTTVIGLALLLIRKELVRMRKIEVLPLLNYQVSNTKEGFVVLLESVGNMPMVLSGVSIVRGNEAYGSFLPLLKGHPQEAQAVDFCEALPGTVLPPGRTFALFAIQGQVPVVQLGRTEQEFPPIESLLNNVIIAVSYRAVVGQEEYTQQMEIRI